MASKKYRKRPSKKIQQRILDDQECRCAYCNIGLDEVKIEWDHFVPYAWERSNKDENYVAACKACNQAKKDRYFASEGDLSDFCIAMVKLHGSLGEGYPEGITARFLVNRAG